MKAWIIKDGLEGIDEIDGYVVYKRECFIDESGKLYNEWFETEKEARDEAIKIKLAMIVELQDEIKRLEGLKF
ncbi:MAG: hypothetical protein PHH73_01980 [Candidatus Rickettsiella isopodorum]|nr:hypothetical protein [Candidatus Rickettsiella isopodorum]